MTLTSLNQYGTHFQIKVISSLLTHKEFLTNIHDIISEEYWDNQAHQWIIKEIIRYYDKFLICMFINVNNVIHQKIGLAKFQLHPRNKTKFVLGKLVN